MKKGFYLAVGLLVISISQVSAQGFHLGIKAGTNISKLSGNAFNQGFQWGFMAGAFAEINVTSKWGIQPELLFSQSQTKTASSFNDVYTQGINSKNVTLNYMTIPVLLTWKPIPLISFQFGPQFGILLNTSQSITTNAVDAFKKNNFSLVGGAQVNLLMLQGGVRYIYGFTNINNLTNADTWKNQNFQVYVGFRIL